MTTSEALRSVLSSENVADSNLEPANVVDVIDNLTYAVRGVGHAITACASPGNDESGGVITSLTEAVMGITSGLFKVAESISELASVVREREIDDKLIP